MGCQNPFNLNWAEGNESSSLVSEISNMSILVSMMKDNASDLFLMMTNNYFLWALDFHFCKSNFCIKNIVVFCTNEFEINLLSNEVVFIKEHRFPPALPELALFIFIG